MYKVDLNCDLGESFGNYTIGLDEEVIRYVSSVNIACGWHAGDPLVMDQTIANAKREGVAVGAHPGFLDLMGFGRRNMSISRQEASAYTAYQLGAFWAFTKKHEMTISHVKPHGALYNMAAKDIELARGICEAIYQFDRHIILLGLAGSKMIEAAREIGLKTAEEVFADRAYEEDGSLVARTKPGAVIEDTEIAIERVIKMVKTGKVTAINGKEIDIACHSICVHGDNKHAVDFVKAIREKLTQENITIAPISEVVRGGV
ncbi:LamB/YcsF family protein [Cellulosilyticum sp. I15G10I2]|uniref:LamB/YcsF family protein n=1 Tax=Cellulosilyticum sp. I15G10I2 TaxID=1892843 RepID=UPI00085CB058|nr:5-oxoprolinase subunit PxpA [Cellulosilyticum sp. I15G10I2]